jgi:hypothetical protein
VQFIGLLGVNQKQILNALGYDDDDQKAKKEAVEKLPLCCQPGEMKQ